MLIDSFVLRRQFMISSFCIDVNTVIVRENTEGEYFGVEHEVFFPVSHFDRCSQQSVLSFASLIVSKMGMYSIIHSHVGMTPLHNGGNPGDAWCRPEHQAHHP